jgi:hypothetical protein
MVDSSQNSPEVMCEYQGTILRKTRSGALRGKTKRWMLSSDRARQCKGATFPVLITNICFAPFPDCRYAYLPLSHEGELFDLWQRGKSLDKCFVYAIGSDLPLRFGMTQVVLVAVAQETSVPWQQF